MSQQKQVSASTVNDGEVPYWIWLCRWLWKLWTTLGILVALPLIVNIISTWLTTSRGKLPDDAPFSVLMTHWLIVLIVSGCLLFLAVLSWAISRWGAPSSTIVGPIPLRDRKHMIRRLRLRYEQMRSQSLQGVVRLELGLASRPTAVHNEFLVAWRLLDQPEQLLSPQTSILDAYKQAQQELLILGEPGIGKSMLLLELALYLVEQAEQDTEQPLPVLLPLSSWANNQRQSLQEWLVEQIAQIYDISPKHSKQWVEAKLVLPLLDGLDEMNASARPVCITAINTHHRESPLPLVVCSRTTEYEGATTKERLALHTAVVVQPLSRKQVDIYLAALGKPSATLRIALKKNPALAELATTPLMLQILILTYHGTTVRQLADKRDVLQQQIWMEYIQSMVKQKGDIDRYPLDRTITWLGWLAHHMRRCHQTVFSPRSQSRNFLPFACQYFCTQIDMLYSGVLGGLVFGLFGALLSGLRFGLFGVLLGGLGFGLPGGYLTALLGVSDYSEKYTTTSDDMHAIAAGCRVTFMVLFIALFCGLFGILFGIQFGIVPGTFIAMLAVMLGMVLGIPVTFFLVWILNKLLPLHEDIMVFYIFRFWLWRAHLFPWKTVAFLEDATKRVLLQRVGKGYGFIHRLLLEYLADLSTKPPSTSPGDHPVKQPPRS